MPHKATAVRPAPYLPSHKPPKNNEQDIQGAAREVKTNS